MKSFFESILWGNVWLRKAVLITIVSLMPLMAMAQFPGGDGTPGNPYQIEDWDHMQSVRDYLDAHFILMNDLNENTTGYSEYVKDLEGEENVVNDGQGWEPIGTPFEPFSGVFDGQGFTIKGLHVDRIGIEEAVESEPTPPLGIGLFGYVSSEPVFFGEQQIGRAHV